MSVTLCVQKACETEALQDNTSQGFLVPDSEHCCCVSRRIIMLVKAGTAVDATIDTLVPLLEEGDQIIDGGNEW